MSRSDTAVQQLVDQKSAYRSSNPNSAALYERARAHLSGGSSRATLQIDPYPIYIDHGEGAYIFDVDGNKRLDMNQNFFSLILGHANKKVASAIARQLEKGTAFGASTEAEVRLAEMICQRAPNLEQIRFVNSGTEATLNAIRVAKAYTGKSKIAKMEGGYHGTHDTAEVSVDPPLNEASGSPDAPSAVLSSPGISRGVADDVIILPWNDAAAIEKIVKSNKEEIAAIIAEPMMGAGGMLHPEPGFLQDLRRITEENGVLLILDEVITFRLAPGGAQEYYGMRADLTSMGKIIGGGLPVGAFGGRADIMEIIDPASPKFMLKTAGTFSANPLTMVAGAAALEQLTPEAIQRINGMGDRLRQDLRDIFKKHGIPAQVTGAGSLFGITFSDKEIRNYRDVAAGDAERKERLFWWMTNNGMLFAKTMRGGITTPMTQADTNLFLEQVDAFARAEAQNA